MRTLIILLQKEFIQIFRNPIIPRLIFIFPVMVMLVMPWVTTMDVRGVKLAIVDLDHSTLSRRICSDISHSEYFLCNDTVARAQQAFDLVEEGQVDIVMQIPEGFERQLTSASPLSIDISANAVNATKGALGGQYLSQTILGTLAKYNSDKGCAKQSHLVTVQYKYNPTLDYRYLMIPALMIMLLIMICGFLSAVNIVQEKESGTIEQINVAPLGRLTFVLGKLIPFWIIGLVVISIAITVAWLVYGLSPAGSLWSIYLATLLFILGFSGFGVAIANISDNIQQTMFLMFFFIIIFMLLSGLLTPISSMPRWAQDFTLLLSPRYYIEIMRSVYLKGTHFIELWQNFAMLGIFVVLFNLLAAITYHRQN